MGQRFQTLPILYCSVLYLPKIPIISPSSINVFLIVLMRLFSDTMSFYSQTPYWCFWECVKYAVNEDFSSEVVQLWHVYSRIKHPVTHSLFVIFRWYKVFFYYTIYSRVYSFVPIHSSNRKNLLIFFPQYVRVFCYLPFPETSDITVFPIILNLH